ncbi:MAG TPA: DUF1330 domain-containing protein [Polyangiaceae bacterium]|nr:DUF1330 domain-containing protein [Polyangiaceae bacterium]
MSAYFIFHNRITDPSKMQEYVPRAFASLTPYEPEFLVLDENSHVVEGSTHLPRTIVIKFKSRRDAEAWYNSPEYRQALPLRLEATEGIAMIVDAFVPAGA